MLEKREFDTNDFLSRLFTAVAFVSGLFSIVVFLLILINYLDIRAADPVNNLIITQMRQEYAALPQKDEALAQRIRDLDLLNRKAFFTSQNHLRVGAILLLVGVSVFLVSFKNALRWRREKPTLDSTPTADTEFLAMAQSRQLITWAGVAMLAIGMGATVLTESELAEGSISATTAKVETTASSGSSSPEETPLVMAAVPSWEDVEKNWPTFRGPGAVAKAHYTNVPMDWDAPSGKGIRWKSEVALPGANSPVVWGNRVFLSGADADKREVYCYDADTGKLVWTKEVNLGTQEPPKAPKVSEDTGFAAPTMAAHGGRVFAIFANGDLVSYDMDGELMWARNLGLPENHYGHASSLLAYENFLYVQYDQSKDPKLLALDISTGKELWVAKRKTISWASPILASTPFGPQLILNSETTVDAYDPNTGTMLWTQEFLGGEVAPSPAYSNGVVFSANEYSAAGAIQLERTDEGVSANLLWEYSDLLPEISSPVGDGERFYFATSMGTFVCLDVKTGEELWAEEIAQSFYASPVLVGDKIYMLDGDGTMHIMQAGPTFKLLGRASMGEPTHATPAFVDGRIYIRTTSHLYCIEQAHANA